jgi:hypothetical protein
MAFPSPAHLLCAITDISPPLVLIYDPTDPDDRFCSRVEIAVSVFTLCPCVPSIRSHFADFITFLFEHRSDFRCTDAKSYMTLFQIRNKRFDAPFLLWQLPAVISNPRFFIDFLLHMKHVNDDFYQQFVNTPGSVDLILDRYVGLLGLTTPIFLIEFILTLFIEKVAKISDPTAVSSVLWDRFLGIFSAPDLTLSVESFRAALLVFNLSRFLFPPEHHVSWLMDLARAAFDIPHLHPICVNFILDQELPGFKMMWLCRLLMSRDSRDGADIRLLSRVVTRIGIQHPLRIVRFMLERATRDAILGPTIAFSVAPIIQCYWETSGSFRDWIDAFVRNCFQFVGISWVTSKYRNRRVTILTFFEAICRFELPFLTRPIVRYWSTLVNSRIVPEWPVNLQMKCDWDMEFEREVRSRTAKGFDIKHMLENLPLPEDAKAKQRAARARPGISVKKPVIAAPLVSKTRNVSLRPATTSIAVKITGTRSIGLRPRIVVK